MRTRTGAFRKPASKAFLDHRSALLRHRSCSRTRAALHVEHHPRTGSRQKTQPQIHKTLLAVFVELLFGFKPFWTAAKAQARKKIAARGPAIGVDSEAEVAALACKADSWDVELAAVTCSDVKYPGYYLQPFHAYDDGNLGWEAAFQVPSAARLVHAPVMDAENRRLDQNGDANLRSSYGANLREAMRALGARPVAAALDVGCATGLSSEALQRSFPGAAVSGLDLSPHFLAVGRVLQRDRPENERIPLRHAAGEATGLPNCSLDLVSICLVLHELPAAATCAIIQEAYRILQPGGTLGIMEMDPRSPAFARIFGNPFAYVPFKATEPWLTEYMALDLQDIVRQAGFQSVQQQPSTPRHLTLAAIK